MNKFKYYFILLITTVSLFSCSKDDAAEIEPPRDYAVQYATDLTDIETYLKTNYITVINNPGFSDDQDVTITKIPEGGTQKSIWDQTTYELKSRNVNLHDITYKLYYLVLREGIGESPSNVDGMLVSYKGDYLTSKTEANVITLTTTQFTDVKYPNGFVDLYGYLRGWKEIIPQFKSGTYDSNVDGTISHKNFGAGVMFIPSGLAYFSGGQGTIPAYAPLVFNFKLYEIQRLDHEFVFSGQSIVPIPDGVKSFQEDLDGDGYMWTKAELPDGAINPDDSDGDGIPNFLDVDDDGDGVSTKLEIKNSSTGLAYPFADIPSCSGNTTDPVRIKKHLDKNCH